MSTYAHACPLCSVLPPAGHQAKDHICHIEIIRGRRSGLHFLARPLRCKHPVPFADVDDSGTVLAGHWNAWAAIVAVQEAERRGFTAEQKARWLYELGIGPHPEITRR